MVIMWKFAQLIEKGGMSLADETNFNSFLIVYKVDRT